VLVKYYGPLSQQTYPSDGREFGAKVFAEGLGGFATSKEMLKKLSIRARSYGRWDSVFHV